MACQAAEKRKRRAREVAEVTQRSPGAEAYARENGYTICTQDLDFGLMLASTGDGLPSGLQIRAQGVLPHQIGVQVLSALRQMAAELDKGALVTIDPKKTRMRVLPLKPRDS